MEDIYGVPGVEADLNKLLHISGHYLATFVETNFNQRRILYFLHILGSLTASDLARILQLRMPSITALVKKLEEKNYITKTQDEVDRRVFHLAITEEGEAALDVMQRNHVARLEELYDAWTEEEKDKVLELLTRLVDSWKINQK